VALAQHATKLAILLFVAMIIILQRLITRSYKTGIGEPIKYKFVLISWFAPNGRTKKIVACFLVGLLQRNEKVERAEKAHETACLA
jgi:hypothetical protein